MITLQNSRATSSKWHDAVSSGILSFSECFLFLLNRGILRTLSNNILQCSQCVFVQYLMLQWNTFLHHTEYFLKIILNISICLNYYFLSFLGKITLHSNATVLMFQVQDKLKMFMRLEFCLIYVTNLLITKNKLSVKEACLWNNV